MSLFSPDLFTCTATPIFSINPVEEDFAQRVLEITDGMGAALYLEATGLPTVVYPGIEKAVWEGRTLNSTIVVVARADAKMPVTGEVLQVRRARIIGAQGHSGHGTFPRVIQAMATGMNMLPPFLPASIRSGRRWRTRWWAGSCERGCSKKFLPHLDLPEEEKQSFAAEVLQRFKNPFIHHRWIDIALNSISVPGGSNDSQRWNAGGAGPADGKRGANR
jgi:hypothetical protein